MKSQFSIPAPENLQAFRDLLPDHAPFRLSSVTTDPELGVVFTSAPQHCFSSKRTDRDKITSDFWSGIAPHIAADTVCIIRQHGQQTVLQLNHAY